LRLREFPLLTDENIHPEIVKSLRKSGADVLDVKESRLIGSSDLVLIRKAFQDGRVVLTHDSDFGQLAVAALEPVIGIVYLRPGHFDPDFTLDTLTTLFDQVQEIEPPFILVAERAAHRVKIRIRKL
jgi:predicted nuclease of predicted toxin-antitoxin system